MTIMPADLLGHITDLAFTPGATQPTEVRVRSHVAQQITDETGQPCPTVVLGTLPVVVDDTLPHFPGFQIKRTGRGK